MTRQSELKNEYMKERRRIQSQLRRLTKAGYDVEYKLPAIPKRITPGSVRRLEKVTAAKVRATAFAPDLETGEKIGYQTFRNRFGGNPSSPKRFTAKRYGLPEVIPQAWEMSLDYFQTIIADYQENSRGLIQGMIASAINAYGRKEVGNVIVSMVEDDEIVSVKDSYNYLAVQRMGNIIMQRLFAMEDQALAIDKAIDQDNESWEQYEGEFDEWPR